ncbi:MAG TPA: hypothetical protein VFW21_02315 [Mycobacterium sp.]|nr:hypothetical protein [Mycobacterium sp.]
MEGIAAVVVLQGTYEQTYAKWIDDRAKDPTTMSSALYTALNARSMQDVSGPEVSSWVSVPSSDPIA